MNNTTFYIHIDQMKILDANAISGPLTYGFPSLNGFLGATHALERKLNASSDFPDIQFDGVLIACRDHKIKIDTSGYDGRFIQKRAPIKRDGKTASITEEGYVDLTVSLIIRAKGSETEFLNSESNKELLEKKFKNFCLSQRFAGGAVISIEKISFYPTEQADSLKKLLLPSYVLIDATDEAMSIYEEMVQGYRSDADEEIDENTGEIKNRVHNPLGSNPTASTLDILLSTLITYQIPPESDDGIWQSYSFKSGRGWLVPIPIGYQAISNKYEPHSIKAVRNPNYPSQFVETIYALGKWEFPHRLKGDFNQYFWRYTETVENLYLIQPNYTD